jgi:arylformamidase
MCGMAGLRLVDLSHPIHDGMVTLPSLPGPELSIHLSREQSERLYSPGTTFEIGRISMVANTGTYVDAPHHRFADGADLAGLPLERLADLPTVVVRFGYGFPPDRGPVGRLDLVGPDGFGSRGIGIDRLAGIDVAGQAVLLHTGDDARFGTPGYVDDAAFLTREAAHWLAANGAALVGIDAANIDDMGDPDRPAHTILLRAGIPIVEHLTGLGRVPDVGARFHAVPPRIVGLGTFPVRAFAVVPDEIG